MKRLMILLLTMLGLMQPAFAQNAGRTVILPEGTTDIPMEAYAHNTVITDLYLPAVAYSADTVLSAVRLPDGMLTLCLFDRTGEELTLRWRNDEPCRFAKT